LKQELALDSRLPKLIFVLLVLYAAVHFSYYYPLLSGVMAAHFNAAGAANGWQPKSAFFEGFVAVSVLATLIGFGLPRLIEVMPVSLVNDLARPWYILAGFLVFTVVWIVRMLAKFLRSPADDFARE
jgi:hypothetical protein